MAPLHLDQTLVAKVTLPEFRVKRRLHQERLTHPLEVHL
jgi:hypothetical protein